MLCRRAASLRVKLLPYPRDAKSKVSLMRLSRATVKLDLTIQSTEQFFGGDRSGIDFAVIKQGDAVGTAALVAVAAVDSAAAVVVAAG